MLDGMQLDVSLGQGGGPGRITYQINAGGNLWLPIQIHASETDPMIGWGWKQSSGDFLTAMQSKTVHFNRFTDGLLLLHVSI